MSLSDWLRPPRHLLALFAAVTLVPAAALVWLGWEFLDRDRAFEAQQAQQRLSVSADRIATHLGRALDDIARDMPSWLDAPPPALNAGAVVLRIRPGGGVTKAGAALPFVPVPAAFGGAVAPAGSAWSAAEALEFRQRDFDGAARAFRTIAKSAGDPDAKAAALVAQARNLRHLGRTDEALAVYRSLEQLPEAGVAGDPADLVARVVQCQLLEQLDRRDELARVSAALTTDLARGRWPIDRASFDLRADQARAWGTLAVDDDAFARAAAIESFWRGRELAPGAVQDRGRQSVFSHDRGVLLVWRTDGEAVTIFAASPAYLAEAWQPGWTAERVAVSLSDKDGHPVLGETTRVAPIALAQSSDTGLPWTVRVTDADGPVDAAAFAARRQLLAWGLAALVILVPAGGYVVWRAVQRELAVARLQADFVSAVSHEFRTPLTSMAHLTERLQRDVSIPTERKRQYYDVLARDTDRLHRFVETLLDFGRLEAGAAPVRPEPSDLVQVVADVVGEFRAAAGPRGPDITVHPSSQIPPVAVDRDTFGRAVWNLLDNAVKYSPAGSPVAVSIHASGREAQVDVTDRGPGVPEAERRQIFQKFVRGAEPRASGIKGTGIGLALVERIVRAHGGHVRLESAVGRGSTFSIVLPFREDAASARASAPRRSGVGRWGPASDGDRGSGGTKSPGER